jgi:gas vesicle protein
MEEDRKLSYFFLGLGIGVAAGILLAPKSGQETRDYIRSKTDEGREYLRRRGDELKETAGDLVDRGRTMVARQKDQLTAAVEAGKQAYRDVVRSPERANSPEGV